MIIIRKLVRDLGVYLRLNLIIDALFHKKNSTMSV